jgi:methionine aminopeptidase
METICIDSATRDKYNTAAKICGVVYKEVLEHIQQGERDVKTLCDFGTRRIGEECKKVFKSVKNKGPAYPVSISLDNCVGNYYHQDGNQRHNKIEKDSVIKIELGTNIGGCIAILGETYGLQDSDIMKYTSFLNKLQKIVLGIMKVGETNDEVRMNIESECTEQNCFPVENCLSYQHLGAHPKTDESKYIILNHKKYYDDDDTLAVEPNVCYEFENHEVYTINITIVPNKDDDSEHVYKSEHDPHIYRFNHYHYNLKLKSSRELFATVKKMHGNNAFYRSDYNQPRDRMGIKECCTNGILDDYPILYESSGLPVYHKKFTVFIDNNKCVLLKYGMN